MCVNAGLLSGVILDMQMDPTATTSRPSQRFQLTYHPECLKRKKIEKIKSSPALNSNVNLLSIFALI